MEELLNLCKTVIYAFIIFIGMKTGSVKVLAILMAIDTFLGMIKAIRLGRKFSFKILAWGIVAKLSILIIPMVLALIGKVLLFEFTYFVIAIINIIIVSEGISCITNVLSIKNNKNIENTDYVTKVLNLAKKALSKAAEGILKSGEDKFKNIK